MGLEQRSRLEGVLGRSPVAGTQRDVAAGSRLAEADSRPVGVGAAAGRLPVAGRQLVVGRQLVAGRLAVVGRVLAAGRLAEVGVLKGLALEAPLQESGRVIKKGAWFVCFLLYCFKLCWSVSGLVGWLV